MFIDHFKSLEKNDQILDTARNTLLIESEAIRDLTKFLDEKFVQIVENILQSPGRVVFTGIGKSANIANKLVATFNSTGTPALFMHAADAIHGDLGLVQTGDTVICISKSGNTPEIKALVPLVKALGNTLIAMVGNTDSFLAQRADFILNTTVSREACPNNLAPTTSTTAQLAMGDALAICLMEQRGFSASDFARFHPGGALGKRLYTTLADLVRADMKPMVHPDTPVREVLMEISKKRQGATAVIDNDRVVGIVTDGDIRRMLEKDSDLNTTIAADVMSRNPKTLESDELAVEALLLLEENSIAQVIVTEGGIYSGIVHLHDLLREGIR